MDWDRAELGRLLRIKRAEQYPKMSQTKLAEMVGASQAQISRWENQEPGDAPSLPVCVRLVDVLDIDFWELVRIVYSVEVEEAVVELAKIRFPDSVLVFMGRQTQPAPQLALAS